MIISHNTTECESAREDTNHKTDNVGLVEEDSDNMSDMLHNSSMGERKSLIIPHDHQTRVNVEYQ